jgi:hypothetical protein
MRRRFTALLLLGPLLAGCGALADPGDGRAASSETPGPVTTPGRSLYEGVLAEMESAGSATFTFSGVGGGQTTSGSGAMRFGDGGYDADVTLTMPDTGRVRAVLLSSASYVALPPTKGLPKDKPWLQVSTPPRTALGREMAPVVAQLRGAFDPAQGIGLVRAARRVEEVGPATVEGVPTTHYRAQIDLRRATRLAEGDVRDQYQSMLDAGVRTLQYDLWTDLSGLPRRFSTDIATTAGLYSVTGIYRRWGDDVRVKAPKPKRVFDADKLEG